MSYCITSAMYSSEVTNDRLTSEQVLDEGTAVRRLADHTHLENMYMAFHRNVGNFWAPSGTKPHR